MITCIIKIYNQNLLILNPLNLTNLSLVAKLNSVFIFNVSLHIYRHKFCMISMLSAYTKKMKTPSRLHSMIP